MSSLLCVPFRSKRMKSKKNDMKETDTSSRDTSNSRRKTSNKRIENVKDRKYKSVTSPADMESDTQRTDTLTSGTETPGSSTNHVPKSPRPESKRKSENGPPDSPSKQRRSEPRTESRPEVQTNGRLQRAGSRLRASFSRLRKSSSRRRSHKTGAKQLSNTPHRLVISEPMIQNRVETEAKTEHLNLVDINALMTSSYTSACTEPLTRSGNELASRDWLNWRSTPTVGTADTIDRLLVDEGFKTASFPSDVFLQDSLERIDTKPRHLEVARYTGSLPRCPARDPSAFVPLSRKGNSPAPRITSMAVGPTSPLLFSPIEPPHSAPCTLRNRGRSDSKCSTYDNVTPQPTVQQKERELDSILSDLFRDISSLSLNNSHDHVINETEVRALPVTTQDDIHDFFRAMNESTRRKSPEPITVSTLTPPSALTPPETPKLQRAVIDETSAVCMSPLDQPTVGFTDHVSDLIDRKSLTELGAEMRERSDSGVGESLNRSPAIRPSHLSGSKHSNTTDNNQSLDSCESHDLRHLPLDPRKIYSLSANQIAVLRKISLLRLSALLDKNSERNSFRWTMPKFMRRTRSTEAVNHKVFGVSLSAIQQRTGQPLPQVILRAMRWLRTYCADTVGVFRRPGVQSRINSLRQQMERDPDSVVFSDHGAYDVADVIKTYFRKLPECLLTAKMTDMILSSQQLPGLTDTSRLNALRSAILLLPDENREALHALLCFLWDFAQKSSFSQMTSTNLAVCFAPSLFTMDASFSTPRTSRRGRSPAPGKAVGLAEPKGLADQRTAYECLTLMIDNAHQLFLVSDEDNSRCRLALMVESPVPSLSSIRMKPGSYRRHVSELITQLSQETAEKWRAWRSADTSRDSTDQSQVFSRRVRDGNPLRTWRVCAELQASPLSVLHVLLRSRSSWDEGVVSDHVISSLDEQTELYHVTYDSMSPSPSRYFTTLRSWKIDPMGCILVSSSINLRHSTSGLSEASSPGFYPSPAALSSPLQTRHSYYFPKHNTQTPLTSATSPQHLHTAGLLSTSAEASGSQPDPALGVKAVELFSGYILESLSQSRCRLTHIVRADLRGRSPEWYNRCYGHTLLGYVTRLRQLVSDAPLVSDVLTVTTSDSARDVGPVPTDGQSTDGSVPNDQAVKSPTTHTVQDLLNSSDRSSAFSRVRSRSLRRKLSAHSIKRTGSPEPKSLERKSSRSRRKSKDGRHKTPEILPGETDSQTDRQTDEQTDINSSNDMLLDEGNDTRCVENAHTSSNLDAKNTQADITQPPNGHKDSTDVNGFTDIDRIKGQTHLVIEKTCVTTEVNGQTDSLTDDVEYRRTDKTNQAEKPRVLLINTVRDSMDSYFNVPMDIDPSALTESVV